MLDNAVVAEEVEPRPLVAEPEEKLVVLDQVEMRVVTVVLSVATVEFAERVVTTEEFKLDVVVAVDESLESEAVELVRLVLDTAVVAVYVEPRSLGVEFPEWFAELATVVTVVLSVATVESSERGVTTEEFKLVVV